jgi:hypothetical protein
MARAFSNMPGSPEAEQPAINIARFPICFAAARQRRCTSLGLNHGPRPVLPATKIPLQPAASISSQTL